MTYLKSEDNPLVTGYNGTVKDELFNFNTTFYINALKNSILCITHA